MKKRGRGRKKRRKGRGGREERERGREGNHKLSTGSNLLCKNDSTQLFRSAANTLRLVLSPSPCPINGVSLLT